jgi:hypothetical protein
MKDIFEAAYQCSSTLANSSKSSCYFRRARMANEVARLKEEAEILKQTNSR